MTNVLDRLAGATAVVLVAGLCTSCTTTPDLNVWAKNSSDLASAISVENKTTLKRIDNDATLVAIGEDEKWQLGSLTSETMAEHKKTYADASLVVDASMDAMVLYANAIANLAAQGETGRQAGESLLGSFKSILTTIGETYAPSAVVTSALTEVAAIVTRVQAQDRLADTMTRLQPAVNKLDDAIQQYTTKQADVVDAVANLEVDLYRQQAGPNRLSWYKQRGGYTHLEKVYGASLVRENDLPLTLNLAATNYVLLSLAARNELYQHELADRAQWLAEQKLTLKRIQMASKAWAKSHDDARQTLANCGGLRSLRYSCGNFTADNLKLAADHIRAVVEAK